MIDTGAQGDDLVTVSAASLVRLRAAAEGLKLPPTLIRAQETGDYHSAYRGRGIEFEESRPYQPGDDVRNIDWRVTARTGRAHTKCFSEERQRPVLVCVDFRDAMFFATRGAFKSVVAARAAALLAWSARQYGDRVGGLLFSEVGHRELRPSGDKGAVLRLIRALVASARWTRSLERSPQALPLSFALARLAKVLRPGSLVFLISDFRVLDPDVERHLARVAGHSTVILVAVHDPIETELPPAGQYWVTDGCRDVRVDSAGTDVRERYRERFARKQEALRGLCRRHGMSLVPVATTADPTVALGTDVIRRALAPSRETVSRRFRT